MDEVLRYRGRVENSATQSGAPEQVDRPPRTAVLSTKWRVPERWLGEPGKTLATIVSVALLLAGPPIVISYAGNSVADRPEVRAAVVKTLVAAPAVTATQMEVAAKLTATAALATPRPTPTATSFPFPR